jgi:hypothetical protein
MPETSVNELRDHYIKISTELLINHGSPTLLNEPDRVILGIVAVAIHPLKERIKDLENENKLLKQRIAKLGPTRIDGSLQPIR